ncbi:MAG: AAA family ATPase [Gammaproteobacteria bacterium]|nr:AAA family ATPase [Gammaproteobacteria bacterium]
MNSYSQEQLFQDIEQHCRVLLSKRTKPLRVAVNGIEGTGKTTFAQRLSEHLNNQSIETHHISIDGFHFDSSIRYRQGRDSAQGYYEDSYDELGFVEKVLIASQQLSPQLTRATHDLKTDEYIHLEPESINSNSIIMTDGAYLFKPNYLPHWDLKIYLHCSFEVAMDRGAMRDEQSLGGIEEAKAKFINRYHAASKIYIQQNNPEQQADIIIDNSNFKQLKLIKGL